MSTQQVLIGIIVIVSLGALAWFLYRPKLQASAGYRATVVPLANIMDVGFIVMAPVIVLLAGYGAPLFMLGLCLVAIAAGFTISYNIRHYEPLAGTGGGVNRVAAVAQWSLLAASVVNIAYYAQLMMTLVLEPLGLFTDNRVTVTAAIVLGGLALYAYRFGIGPLSRIAERTTAFNLAAVVTVVVAFLAFNIFEAIGGNFDYPAYDPPDEDNLRKLVGFFALVQGFEAARYIGAQFGPEVRIAAMRRAQLVAYGVFVLLIGTSLLLFARFRPEPDITAIFVIAKEVTPFLPWLLLIAAIGSQASAIIGATTSRSGLLIESTHETMKRKFTFIALLVPAIVIVLVADVLAAVALASRVFAAYFLIQAVIAGMLAAKNGSWLKVAGFAAIGVVMAFIMIFGLPV